MRLNHFLAQAGVASRRHADQLILAGKIKVNGKTITKLGTQVELKKDRVEYNGQRLKPADNLIYYAVNKPKGVVSSATSQASETTIMDLVPKKPRVFPAGRLDKSSEGLMILTNDGLLVYKLTHPKFNLLKSYQVTLDRKPNDDQIRRLSQGIMLKEGKTEVTEISYIPENNTKTIITMTLHQGWYHQIKRMVDRVGLTVREIRRTQIGPISLDGLSKGKYRKLTGVEIEKLKAVVGE